jgi:NADPH:quinone reductase-like Zn-dependent oxidoreductase
VNSGFERPITGQLGRNVWQRLKCRGNQRTRWVTFRRGPDADGAGGFALRTNHEANKQAGKQMKAARIREFGAPDVITIDDLPLPKPARGEVLVRVYAAGVGSWDALVREGKSELHQPLPLILGSELSGVVEATGDGVVDFKSGDEVYGATNGQFTGADAEYALASAGMIAHKPGKLAHIEAASSPIGAVTAWQMIFDYAHATAGQTVLVHGAAGNVGAYAVQLARRAGLHTIATAGAAELDYVKSLGAEHVVDYRATRFEDAVGAVDAVIDTVGGDTQQRSLSVLKYGGILVSAVSAVPETAQLKFGVRAVFFYVEVTTGRLNKISQLFDEGALAPRVGTVLPLADVRTAHELLRGAAHGRGKIVLQVAS